MRNLVILSILLALASDAFCQQGHWFLGGQGGFSYEKRQDPSAPADKQSTWSCSPECGTWLSDAWQVGFGLRFSGYTQKGSVVAVNGIPFRPTNRQRNLGAMLYGRYLLGQGAFRPFGGVNVSLLPGRLLQDFDQSSPQSPPDMQRKTLSWNTSLQAGFAYTLAPGISVLGSLGLIAYSGTSSEVSGRKTRLRHLSADVSSLGNRFNIGLYFLL